MNPNYINSLEFHNFTNHWTACPNCYPQHDRYCEEGKHLKHLYNTVSTKPDVSTEPLEQLAPVIPIRRKKR